jgi:hypothetical protein
MAGVFVGDVKHWPVAIMCALCTPKFAQLQSLDEFGHVVDDIQGQTPLPTAAPSYFGLRLVRRPGGGLRLSLLYRRLLPVADAFPVDVILGVDLMAIDDCAMTWTDVFKGKAYAQLATALKAIHAPRTFIASPIFTKPNAITKIISDNRLIYLFADRCTEDVFQLFMASRPDLGQAFHGQRRSMFQYGEDFSEFHFLAWDDATPVFVTTHLQVIIGTSEVFRDADLATRGTLPPPVQRDHDEASMLQQLNPGAHVSVSSWAEGFRPLQLAAAKPLLAMVLASAHGRRPSS